MRVVLTTTLAPPAGCPRPSKAQKGGAKPQGLPCDPNASTACNRRTQGRVDVSAGVGLFLTAYRSFLRLGNDSFYMEIYPFFRALFEAASV
jgi:hypothetical protein